MSVRELMEWLQASGLGHFMRESGPWTYGIVNLVHLLGIALLFGSIVIIDLRLLGAWRRAPLGLLADIATPLGAIGFVVAATSGVFLITANATEYIGNPFIYVKFPAIAIGLVNGLALHRSAAWQARGTRELSPRERRQLALMGGASLVSWLTAIGAGRMIGYW